MVTEIVKESNYYPFGLKHKGYNDNVSPLGNSVAKRYMFGGKELDESLDLDTYDFGARNYDPALGRWMNIDPLAEQMRRHSPYNYAFNNPIFFIDPDGMMPYGSLDGGKPDFEDDSEWGRRTRAKDQWHRDNPWDTKITGQAGNDNGEGGCCPTQYDGSGVAIGDNVVNVLDEVVVTGTRNTGIAGDNVLGNAILFGSTLTRSTSTVLETFPTTFPEQKFADFSELDDIAKRMRGLESLNKYKGLSSSLTKGLAGLSIANDLTRYGLGLQSGARTTYHLTGTGIALGVGYLVSAPASLAATAAFIAGEKYYDSVQASKVFNASNRASIEIGGGNPDANIISVRAMENFISGGEFQ